MGLQATNAGIDFQQRVSAYMMILMEFDMDISLALQVNKSNTIKEINFEDCESIDDLVITLDSGKKLYFQMKRTISLSDDAESEFYGVCEQFVKQFLKQNENDLAYILAIRTEPSKAISVKLKRILEGIRLANNLEVIDKLNREERTIFGKVSANIKTIYKKYTSKDISEDDLLKLLLRIYVELFDIESGEEYEKTIKLILWNLIEVDVELFWRTFISKAVEYGANRRCLSQENLKEQCKSYFKENKTESNILTEPFWGRVWKEGCKDIEVQIDYVLAIPTQTTREEMSIEEDTIFYFELYRFDDSKKKDSLKYIAPNKMIWQNGLEFEVLFRCSSQERCGNYIEQELSKKLEDLENKYKVIAWPVKEHFPYTEVELLHKEVLEKSFESSKECRCANCGKAIFDDKVYIIEIDNEECKNTVGMAHETCVRPVDRIIGEANIPGIEDYSYLKHFDIDYWAKMVIKGKRVWENIELMAAKCSPLVIDADEVFHDGNYCLYQILDNGDKRYTLNRGVIDRLSRKGAELLQEKFNENLITAKNEGNPFGYSSKSYIYGRYAKILEQVGDKEDFIECIEAKVELYNESVAKIYNDCETYYVPIIYLSVEGDPFILPNGVFPMITNPFELPKYIKNWEKMGIEMPDYEVCIIKDDNEFILKMISLINNGILPVANGMFAPNKNMIRGTHIHLMWEVEEQYQEEVEKAAEEIKK